MLQIKIAHRRYGYLGDPKLLNTAINSSSCYLLY